MNVILLGCPGSGKGSQAEQIVARYRLAHIATGNIFREEISRKTPLGEKAAKYVNAGYLVPDALVLEVVAERLKSCPNGFLLDGFPRTLEQAQSLDGSLEKDGKRIDLVAFLDIGEEEALRRLTSRRNCPQCGALYNTLTRPSRDGVRCDVCQKELIQREDDKPETVKKRLKVYWDLTEPLVAYYKSEQIFARIDAEKPLEEVAQALLEAIEDSLKGAPKQP